MDVKKILFATDHSARSDRALERAVDLARLHGARLTVLHVVDGDLARTALEAATTAAEEEIASALAGQDHADKVTIDTRVVTGSAFQQIVDMADGEGCDLVVLGRHRNESCIAAFGGTTMTRVVRVGRLPVLIVVERCQEPYRRVMVGVDFSAAARSTIRAAFALAPGAEFHFVHAYDVPFQGFLSGAETRESVARENEEELRVLVADEVQNLTGARPCSAPDAPSVELLPHQGDVLGTLRQEAARLRPDLLAVGTHGRSGLGRIVLGSIAQDLLDSPPCDILAVRAAEEG